MGSPGADGLHRISSAGIIDRTPQGRIFFHDLVTIPAIPNREGSSALLGPGRGAHRPEIDEEYSRSIAEQYDTAVRYTSDRIGAFLASLEQRGLYDNTLILLGADHGEELFVHGGFSHGYSLYDEVLKVPLFVKLPQQTWSAVIDAPTMLTDLYPSILDLLKIKIEHEVDGQSFVSRLHPSSWGCGGTGAGQEEPRDVPPRDLFFHLFIPRRGIEQAVRSGPYKLIEIERNYRSVMNSNLLYQLEADPGEAKNLAREEIERTIDLHEKLQVQWRSWERVALAPPHTVEHDPETEEALRAMGYIE